MEPNLYFCCMFTGIIEATGTVVAVAKEGSNKTFIMDCPFTEELREDQSVSHNGVCLTVAGFRPEGYLVTAVAETLHCSNLELLQAGDIVNLERCMPMNGRLDGHIVQGHVDTTGTCEAVKNMDGSWVFEFSYDPNCGHLTVSKGSIAVNGVSLTVVDPGPGKFSVVIIPYTFEHTQFSVLKAGMKVNLEFDIIGKYVKAWTQQATHG